MKVWIFIFKESEKDRVEIYGNLKELYEQEKEVVEIMNVKTLSYFRKIVKEKLVNVLFHIEKKEVKRSKHKTP